MADVVAIGLRAAAAAAALMAAGLPVFVFWYGRLLDRSSRRVRATVSPTALIALTLLVLHALVEPVRLAGAWNGMFDPSLHALLLSSDFGTALAIRALGLSLIAGSRPSAGPQGAGLALIGATLIAASFAFMGHTAADPRGWLLAPLLVVHLLAIAFWLGALWPLLTVARVETASVAGTVIAEFSRTALRVVPFVLLAGLTMAGLLLPGLSSLGSPYGISLIIKLIGFSVLIALAGLNRLRLSSGVSRGRRSSQTAFQAVVLTELVLLIAVVTVTAVMTALFSPDH